MAFRRVRKNRVARVLNPRVGREADQRHAAVLRPARRTGESAPHVKRMIGKNHVARVLNPRVGREADNGVYNGWASQPCHKPG